MYDAVLLASDDVIRKQSGRKALILLTDGVDNGSKTSLFSSIEAAQRADTLVYSILFEDPEGNVMMPTRGRPGMGSPRGNPHDRGKKEQPTTRATRGGGFCV